MPKLYDDEDTEAESLRQATGIGKDEEGAMEREAYNGAAEDIGKRGGFFRDAERSASRSQLGKAEKAGSKSGLKLTEEAAGVGGAAAIAAKAKNIFLGSKARKNSTAGGVVSGIIALIIFMFLSIASGPAQFIYASHWIGAFFNHVVAFDNDRNSRMSKWQKWASYKAIGKAERGRLTFRMNLVADHMERKINQRGLKSVYKKGRLVEYKIIKGKGHLAKQYFDELRNAGIDVDGMQHGDVLDLRGTNHKSRRNVVKAVVHGTHSNRLTQAIGLRPLKKRGGITWSVLQRIKEARDKHNEKKESKKKQKEQQKERYREREKEYVKFGAIRGILPKIFKGGGDEHNDRRSRIFRKYLEKFKSLVKSINGPIGAVAAVVQAGCLASDLLDELPGAIDAINIANQEGLIRMGTQVISVGDQVRNGNLKSHAQGGTNMDQLQLDTLSEHFYDPKTKTSWVDDPRIQAKMGLPITGKDSLEGEEFGKENGFGGTLDTINGYVNKVPHIGLFRGAVCSAVNKVNSAIAGIIKGALGAIGLYDDVQDFNKFLIKKTHLKDLFDKIINYLTTSGADTAARGARAGGLWAVGSRLGASDESITQGGVKIPKNEEGAVIKNGDESTFRTDNHQGFYEKYLSPYNPTSMTASIVMKMPKSFGGFLSSIGGLPSTVLGSITGLFSAPTVSAAGSDGWDYQFPIFGFSVDLSEDPRFDNPYENEVELLKYMKMRTDMEDACASVYSDPDPRSPHWIGLRWIKCEIELGDSQIPSGHFHPNSWDELNTGDSHFACEPDGDNNDCGGDTPLSIGCIDSRSANESWQSKCTNSWADDHANGIECFGVGVTDDERLAYGAVMYQPDIPDRCAKDQFLPWLRYRFLIADIGTNESLVCRYGETGDSETVSACQNLQMNTVYGYGDGGSGGGSGGDGGDGQIITGAQKKGWSWPLSKGDYPGSLSQCYKKPGHTGIDIPVPTGTRVLAARDGIVVKADHSGTGDGGKDIIIKHADGLWSNYQHNSKVYVNVGDKVKRGQVIAKSGATGHVTGAHIHFSITTKQGLDSRHTVAYSLDPLKFLPKIPGRNLSGCS